MHTVSSDPPRVIITQPFRLTAHQMGASPTEVGGLRWARLALWSLALDETSPAQRIRAAPIAGVHALCELELWSMFARPARFSLFQEDRLLSPP